MINVVPFTPMSSDGCPAMMLQGGVTAVTRQTWPSHAGGAAGTPLGTPVGTPVGGALGTPVGTPVGGALGTSVGTPVGGAVGTPVGGTEGTPGGGGTGRLVDSLSDPQPITERLAALDSVHCNVVPRATWVSANVSTHPTCPVHCPINFDGPLIGSTIRTSMTNGCNDGVRPRAERPRAAGGAGVDGMLGGMLGSAGTLSEGTAVGTAGRLGTPGRLCDGTAVGTAGRLGTPGRLCDGTAVGTAGRLGAEPKLGGMAGMLGPAGRLGTALGNPEGSSGEGGTINPRPPTMMRGSPRMN
ncbi:MAG: hypothetical protein ACYDCC_05290 [Actinomycetota bacterium]